MNTAMEDLARRAVACSAFRPMRGMVGMDGTVILSVGPLVETSEIVEWRDGGTIRRDHREVTWPVLRASGWRPDFDQPATRGCMLALIEEAHGVSDITIRPIYEGGCIDRWVLNSYEKMQRRSWNSVLGVGPLLADALVVALESASQTVEPW
jgi:hypothetical protein